LYTYGADLDDMSYRAATYVDKILRGAKPADIPVELPTKYNFVINAKTARDMGIVIPGALMLRATRVID
jgi:putative ABC transport system substrate-binding protein